MLYELCMDWPLSSQSKLDLSFFFVLSGAAFPSSVFIWHDF